MYAAPFAHQVDRVWDDRTADWHFLCVRFRCSAAISWPDAFQILNANSGPPKLFGEWLSTGFSHYLLTRQTESSCPSCHLDRNRETLLEVLIQTMSSCISIRERPRTCSISSSRSPRAALDAQVRTHARGASLRACSAFSVVFPR